MVLNLKIKCPSARALKNYHIQNTLSLFRKCNVTAGIILQNTVLEHFYKYTTPNNKKRTHNATEQRKCPHA